MHEHLVTVHGKALHLCRHCGKNYVSEKSRKAHENKCPKKDGQPQPQNEGDKLFAPDDPGFDAALEVKEEEAEEDETTSEVIEASFGSEATSEDEAEAGQNPVDRTQTPSVNEDDKEVAEATKWSASATKKTPSLNCTLWFLTSTLPFSSMNKANTSITI